MASPSNKGKGFYGIPYSLPFVPSERLKLRFAVAVLICLSIVVSPFLVFPAPAQAAATTSITITKYDAYGSVLSTQTVTWEWMRDNLPVQGNGEIRYYHQGPTFDDTSLNTLWNPSEDVNVESRDYGCPKGTDVKDLCSLVGGAAPGDTIRIKASDNFNKWFDYEDVYKPEPEQGKLVVCWYNADYGGYVSENYTTGMRLLFFADTSVNPGGRHVFGLWDMHNTLPASRWHYYYDGSLWPSSSGLSVQNVFYIDIYQPNLVSCNASGNAKDSFAPGETVYVKGLGLSANTNYKLWIQDEPVLEKPLNDLERPEGTYVLNSGNDPSGSQESVSTDANGDFAPLAIWVIDPSATPHKYDIVADNQASGTVGTFDTDDAIDAPGWQGFSVAPPLEIISFTVTDYGNDGIRFSTLLPGAVDQPADGQPAQGAVTITVGSETNVDVDVQVKGTDFSGTGTISVGNVKYNNSNDPDPAAGATALTGSYVTWYSVLPATQDVRSVYYWISVPAGQAAGSYTNSFYYQAIKSTS